MIKISLIKIIQEERLVAFYYTEPSRTFNEFLLLPNLTTKECTPNNVDLSTPITK